MAARPLKIASVRTEITFDDGTVYHLDLAADASYPIEGEFGVRLDTVSRPDESGMFVHHEPSGLKHGRINLSGRAVSAGQTSPAATAATPPDVDPPWIGES